MTDFLNSRDQQLLRFLKALKRSAAAGVRGDDGVTSIVIEAGAIRRILSFPGEVADLACSQGLAERRDRSVALTEAGRARLLRAQEPDAPFLAQHRPLERMVIRQFETPTEVMVDQAESPLAWLRRRRGKNGAALVSEEGFLAGERLRADYTRANLLPRVTANWQAQVSSGRRADAASPEFSDVVVAARQRVDAALRAVGPELSGVLVDVCCFLKGIEQVERDRGWPLRSGKVVLVLALARLASHYGIASMPRKEGRGALRSWGGEGYRPSIASRKASGRPAN
jgi:hypothetical protein